MKTLLHILILLTLFSCAKQQKIDCCDILLTYAKKPQAIEFVDCKKGTDQTIIEANYRVLAKNALEIEKYLITTYGIGKLKFACSGWESENGKNGYFDNKILKKINENYTIQVVMYASGEQKDSNGILYFENDRKKVKYFNVTVSILNI